MITQDKVKVIAEYDGWELRGEPEFIPPYKIWIKHLPHGTNMIPYISPSGKEYDDWAKEIKYLTSLDWLHPVAMKVFEDLQEIKPVVEVTGSPIYYMGKDLLSRCGNKPVNGEYIDLFNAVYDGIVFLNSNK